MPVAPTFGEQIIEAGISGPDQANRLYTVTGTAGLNFTMTNQAQDQIQTFTFLVGPTFTRTQFYRAIGTASVSSQTVTIQSGGSITFVQINSVEADWDDESGRVEVRVEISASGPVSGSLMIQAVRYWVTILAQV